MKYFVAFLNVFVLGGASAAFLSRMPNLMDGPAELWTTGRPMTRQADCFAIRCYGHYVNLHVCCPGFYCTRHLPLLGGICLIDPTASTTTTTTTTTTTEMTTTTTTEPTPSSTPSFLDFDPDKLINNPAITIDQSVLENYQSLSHYLSALQFVTPKPAE